MIISASIIATNSRNMEKAAKQLEYADANFIRIDTMDERFFDYIGLGLHIIKTKGSISSRDPCSSNAAVSACLYEHI
ncbi:hypothetical protein DRN63_03980 [Nanoarchaeota archaeon]|nr:MAG: hypothetical protein DRN63_03980 [Nanoarchaeota archaeon]